VIPQPDHLSRSQSVEIGRRRRGRNWAMLIILVSLAALFYAISIVKLFHHGPS
jgi:hypothetical protein